MNVNKKNMSTMTPEDASGVIRRAARRAMDGAHAFRLRKRRTSSSVGSLLRRFRSSGSSVSSSSSRTDSSCPMLEFLSDVFRRARNSKFSNRKAVSMVLSPSEFIIGMEMLASCPASASKMLFQTIAYGPTYPALVSMCSLSASELYAVARRLHRKIAYIAQYEELELDVLVAQWESSSERGYIARNIEEFSSWLINELGFKIGAKLMPGELRGLLMILTGGSDTCLLATEHVIQFMRSFPKDESSALAQDAALAKELGEVQGDAARENEPRVKETQASHAKFVVVDVFIAPTRGADVRPKAADDNDYEQKENEGKEDDVAVRSSDLYRSAGPISRKLSLWYRLGSEDEFASYAKFVRARVTDVAISPDAKLMIASGFSEVLSSRSMKMGHRRQLPRPLGKLPPRIWIRRRVDGPRGISAITITSGSFSSLRNQVWSPPCRDYMFAGALNIQKRDAILWYRHVPCAGVEPCEEAIEARSHGSSLTFRRVLDRVRRCLIKKCDTDLRIAKLDIRKRLEDICKDNISKDRMTRRQARLSLCFLSLSAREWQVLLEYLGMQIPIDRVLRAVGFNPIEVYHLVAHLRDNMENKWRILQSASNMAVEFCSELDSKRSSSPAIGIVAKAFMQADTDQSGALPRAAFADALAKAFPSFSFSGPDIQMLATRFACANAANVNYEKMLFHIDPSWDFHEPQIEADVDDIYIGLKPHVLKVLSQLQRWLLRHASRDDSGREVSSVAFQVFSHDLRASTIPASAFEKRLKRFKFAASLSRRDIDSLMKALFGGSDHVTIGAFSSFLKSQISPPLPPPPESNESSRHAAMGVHTESSAPHANSSTTVDGEIADLSSGEELDSDEPSDDDSDRLAARLKRFVTAAADRGINSEELIDSYCPERERFDEGAFVQMMKRMGIDVIASSAFFRTHFGVSMQRSKALIRFREIIGAPVGSISEAMRAVTSFINSLSWKEASADAIERIFSANDIAGTGMVTSRQFTQSLSAWCSKVADSHCAAIVMHFSSGNKVDYVAFSKRIARFPGQNRSKAKSWIKEKLWAGGMSPWSVFGTAASLERQQFSACLFKALPNIRPEDVSQITQEYARGRHVDTDAFCRDLRPTFEEVVDVKRALLGLIADAAFVRGHALNYASLFEKHDWDDSGIVSRSTFVDCCCRAGLALQPRNMQILLEVFDENGKNRVNYALFCAMLAEGGGSGSRERMTAMRRFLTRHGEDIISDLEHRDALRSGFVTEEDFCDACARARAPLDREQLKAIVGILGVVGKVGLENAQLRFVAYRQFLSGIMRAGGPNGIAAAPKGDAEDDPDHDASIWSRAKVEHWLQSKEEQSREVGKYINVVKGISRHICANDENKAMANKQVAAHQPVVAAKQRYLHTGFWRCQVCFFDHSKLRFLRKCEMCDAANPYHEADIKKKIKKGYS